MNRNKSIRVAILCLGVLAMGCTKKNLKSFT